MAEGRKAQLLREIRGFVKRNGYAPTVRDLAEALGVGHSTIQAGLRELVEDGMVRKAPGVARGIVVKGERDRLG
jgi:repressor LexA